MGAMPQYLPADCTSADFANFDKCCRHHRGIAVCLLSAAFARTSDGTGTAERHGLVLPMASSAVVTRCMQKLADRASHDPISMDNCRAWAVGNFVPKYAVLLNAS